MTLNIKLLVPTPETGRHVSCCFRSGAAQQHIRAKVRYECVNERHIMGHWELTDHFLNTFIAPRISSLWKCGAPNLEPEDKRWLNRFIKTSFLVDLSEKGRAYLFNFIRRTEGAFWAYH
ncbi:MAG: hypothetical protein ACE5FY_07485 [Nitrospiria bacterium]